MRLFPPPVFPSNDMEARNRNSDKFELGSLTNVVVAHDFLCPWCYVGWFHAKRLTQEFGLTLDWRGFELMPPEMEYTPSPPKPVDPDAPPAPPPAPSRFELFAVAEGITMPTPRPPFTRTHNALLGAEWARSLGDPAAFDTYNDAVYKAFWEQCADIADVDVLAALADGAGLSGAACADSVRAKRWEENITPYDDEAYRVGIRHVPSFIFNGEELLAEAPYADLARAAERFLIRAEKFTGKAG